MFRPISIWPFPEQRLKEISLKSGHIIVAEHNYGQMLLEVERIVKDQCTLSHIGKVDGNVITPKEILDELKEVASHGKSAG